MVDVGDLRPLLCVFLGLSRKHWQRLFPFPRQSVKVAADVSLACEASKRVWDVIHQLWIHFSQPDLPKNMLNFSGGSSHLASKSSQLPDSQVKMATYHERDMTPATMID